MITALLARYALPLKLAASVAIITAAFTAGWTVNGWRMDAVVEGLNAQHSQDKADAVAATNRALVRMTEDRDKLAADLSTIDSVYSQKLKGQENENVRLRDCVRIGTCGLRVHTVPVPTCAPGDQARSPEGGSVDSGTGSRLTADAESAYFSLRTGIGRVQTKLAACQAAVRGYSNDSRPSTDPGAVD